MKTPAIVQAVNEHIGFEGNRKVYAVRYRAMVLKHDATRHEPAYLYSLVWDGEDQRSFETFQEAQRVVLTYVEGPPEDCVRARWDDQHGEWEVVEAVHHSGRGDREDFHADG